MTSPLGKSLQDSKTGNARQVAPLHLKEAPTTGDCLTWGSGYPAHLSLHTQAGQQQLRASSQHHGQILQSLPTPAPSRISNQTET